MMKRMMGYRLLAVAVATVFLSIGCSDDSDSTDGTSGGGGGGAGEPAPAEIQDLTGVFGFVKDGTGAAIGDVLVSVGGALTSSDSDGYFELEVPASEKIVVRFEKDGFLPGIRTAAVNSNNKPSAVEATLIAEAPAVELDADAGGTVTGSRGAEMNAPAGAFVDGSGNAVTGMVDVHLTPLDPSVAAELDAYPGDLTAEEASGEMTTLESFGVVDFTVRQNGEKLDVADGTMLDVRIPAPASGATPPETIALWSYDEEVGIWKEEGTATFDSASNTYTAQIGHMSFWNCDQTVETGCIRGLVVDSTDTPIPGAYIEAKGIDYNGQSTSTSKENGEFCVNVRVSSDVQITAFHPSGVGLGVVTRDVESEAMTAPVPCDCTDEECVDRGTWKIENYIDCTTVDNPVAGTCAEDLFNAMLCFQPSGTCDINSSTGQITWSNGASIQYDSFDVTSGGGSFDYVGPDGNVCATGTVPDFDSAEDDFDITITTAGGDTYTLRSTGDSTGQTVICPDGTEVELDSLEQDIYDQCTGSDGLDDDAACTFDGADPGAGLGGEGGFGDGTCTTDADCPSTFGLEFVCCEIPGAGVSTCTIPEACNF